MLGVGGKPKAGNTIHKEANSSAVSSVEHTNCQVCLVRPDGRQQQFDTPSSLISAHQWPHGHCSGPSWFYRVGKRPPVKADLAIYSLIVGMSGQWEDVATMLNIKLDFCCCDNSVGFSHKCFKPRISSQCSHRVMVAFLQVCVTNICKNIN